MFQRCTEDKYGPQALDGATGVFLNTDFHKGAGGEADKEIAQGRAVIDAAKQARCSDARQIQLSWRCARCMQLLQYVTAPGPPVLSNAIGVCLILSVCRIL